MPGYQSRRFVGERWGRLRDCLGRYSNVAERLESSLTPLGVERGLKKALAILSAGLKMAAFGPFIPSVDKDEAILPWKFRARSPNRFR
jgi:hypothetical protein